MDQDGHAGLHLEGAVEQIFGGHALEHHTGGLLIADGGGYLHGAFCRQKTFRRITPERADIADTITDLDVGYPGSDRGHLSSAFIAGHER